MQVRSPGVKIDMQKRLRRIEGQVRGVQRMIDEERDCREVVQQLNAVRSAVQNATVLFVRAYAKECLLPIEEIDVSMLEGRIDDLITLMARTE